MRKIYFYKYFCLLFLLFAFVQGCFAKTSRKDKGYASPKILIDNNSVWKDTKGDDIRAQGGCIIKIKNKFNWIGSEIKGNGDTKFYALNRYTSTDLIKWTKQKPILSPGMTNIPFLHKDWVARPWVFFHKETSTYIMYCEWNDHSDPVIRNNQIAVLTAPEISGPWVCDTVYYKLQDSFGKTFNMGDLGGFQDDDGNAYLMYTFDKGGPNKAQAIVKLEPTSFKRILSPSQGGLVAEFSDDVREAASILKRDSIYYYFTSNCVGWAPSETQYRTATSMNNKWSDPKVVSTEPTQSSTFHTQHDFILPITGTKATTFVYFGDRWSVCSPNKYDGVIGLYAWYPIEFDTKGNPVIKAKNYLENGGDWYLNVITGEHKVAPTIIEKP